MFNGLTVSAGSVTVAMSTYLVVFAQLEFQLDRLLQAFETPVTLFGFQSWDSKKLFDGGVRG